MQNWTVRTLDCVSLLNPEGDAVGLAYRKVGELLVMLLDAPCRSASRVNLGAALWPSSGVATRATNLRQALSHLRAAIGDESIITTRVHCGLAESFQCVFAERVAVEAAAVSVPEWLAGWVVFLQALSVASPVQFFDAIRANAALLCDLPQSQLCDVVERAAAGLQPDHLLVGWCEFSLGMIGWKSVPQASRHFLVAARHAAGARDFDLFARAVFWLCACQILRGRIDDAQCLVADALGVIGSSAPSNASMLTAIKATAFLHGGHFRESRDLMERVAKFGFANAFECQQYEALRAFYLATTGFEPEALRLVDDLRRGPGAHRGGRVDSLLNLACATVDAVSAPSLVVDTLEPTIRGIEAMGQDHLMLYATETMAASLARCGMKEAARETADGCRHLRGRLGLTVSNWDSHRLAPLAAIA